MQLKENIHLAYCTNIHRGQNWAETFETLKQHTLKVRDRVAKGKAYAIGLRLSDTASRELSDKERLLEFQRWLERESCYVFTINGFPYGTFHGGRVKELAYVPDWTTNERVEYTNRLFNLLAEITPQGIAGSVSTVPGSFKPLIHDQQQVEQMRRNLWRTVEHIQQLSERTGRSFHLGLEPEPLCYLETSAETVEFFEQLQNDRPGDYRLREYLGVNYDCCHLAVEYESPDAAIEKLRAAGIRISKLHFSSALKVKPSAENRVALNPFIDSVYFHQVIARNGDGSLTRYPDLDEALAGTGTTKIDHEEEWRIHFHIPLHCPPIGAFQTTSDHVEGVMDILKSNPALCSHIEMETYTWEVLPPAIKNRDVVDQLAAEYEWTLGNMAARGLV